ncbi:thermonuclease family protein [Shewanella sp. SM32]|uniref:thermonuclease family protein n=1 Tax=Shewanella sp. SM32 TaxID=2912796 RepID=UPI0021D9832B|nr:thermonuclease family protein [Shewanella sp. SM32]MCU8071008.1 thermonuclease family protein [Shewanella sp. SM32]
MSKLIFILLSIFIVTKSNAGTQESVTVSTLISIYDGDSFTVNVDEWPPILGQKITIRIKGVDTPELRGKCKKEVEMARLAKQFTVSKLRESKTIRLTGIERDKYFRILADVSLDGIDLGRLLLEAKLAVPYTGAKKLEWCNIL